MRVLGLCSYPVEAAATRFRLAQFVEPLGEHGIELSLRPFLDSRQFHDLYSGRGAVRKAVGMIEPLLQRVAGMAEARKYDVLVVQREAMFFGPALFERLYRRFGRLPMVLDLDDATYIPYVSPSYGRVGSFLKFFGKANELIRSSSVVTCGNRFIAEYASSLGAETEVVPTVVDPDVFRPIPGGDGDVVVGWIGTHSTFRVLESIFPVMQRLAARHKFVFKIIGSGRDEIRLPGVEVQNLPWRLDREVEDFQSLDIGLYPVAVTESMPANWIVAKSGFKAIQYLAVGIPFVMSPVGVCAEIGVPGSTHFNANSHEEWFGALDKLLSDGQLRQRMGAAGRRHSLEHYSLQDQVKKLSDVFHSVAERAV